MRRSGLDFEPDLLKELSLPKRQRRARSGRGARILAALLLGPLVLAAGAMLGIGYFSGDDPALRQAALTLFEGLYQGQPAVALSVCAEGEPGMRLLAEEEARIFTPDARPAPPSDPSAAAQARIAELAALRQALTVLGVDWTQARPLAVGGFQAALTHPQYMAGKAHLFLGNLYIESGGAIFAIEVTARRCGNAWVFQEAWNPRAIGPDAGSAQADATACYKAFASEPHDPADPTEIQRAKAFYLPLTQR